MRRGDGRVGRGLHVKNDFLSLTSRPSKKLRGTPTEFAVAEIPVATVRSSTPNLQKEERKEQSKKG